MRARGLCECCLCDGKQTVRVRPRSDDGRSFKRTQARVVPALCYHRAMNNDKLTYAGCATLAALPDEALLRDCEWRNLE